MITDLDINISPDLLLVDAKSLLWRGVMGTPDAPVAYWLHYFTMLGQLEAHRIVCWDSSGKTARRAVYPDYKAHKKDQRDEHVLSTMRKAEDDLKKILALAGVQQAWAPQWEADDVIGTIVDGASDLDIAILSSDRDFYQLLSKRVVLLTLNKKSFTVTTKRDAEKKVRIPIKYITKLKAVTGDRSDNIPGIPGYGEKRAPKLLEKCGFKLKRVAKETGFSYEKLMMFWNLVKINRKVELKWLPERPDRKKLVERLIMCRCKNILAGKKYLTLME